LAWTTPKTWTSGSALTAAELNEQVRDNLAYLKALDIIEQTYEEGTWTPTGNGETFAVATGRYTRVGRLVHVEFTVQWPSTSDSNQAKVMSLPFTVGYGAGVTIGYTSVGGVPLVLASTGTTELIVYTAAGAASPNSSWSTHSLIGSCSYSV
jgi:hypothetical protein